MIRAILAVFTIATTVLTCAYLAGPVSAAHALPRFAAISTSTSAPQAPQPDSGGPPWG